MPYDAAGMWKPESDSSVDKLDGMLSSGSPYLEMAKAAGTRTAADRGLQNSTMGAQAGEAAAIAAAQPFAINDANTTAQKNLSFQGFGQQGALDKVNNDAAATRQAADIGAQQTRLTTQITSNEGIADKDAQNKLALQQLSGDQQARIANMNVAANAQDKAQNAAISASNIYTQNINAIIGNANIPADARAALMDNAKNELNANYALIEQIYNIKLDWSSGSGSGSTPAAASSYGGSTAQTQSQATANYTPNVGVQTLNQGSNGYTGPVGFDPDTGTYIDSSGNRTT